MSDNKTGSSKAESKSESGIIGDMKEILNPTSTDPRYKTKEINGIKVKLWGFPISERDWNKMSKPTKAFIFLLEAISALISLPSTLLRYAFEAFKDKEENKPVKNQDKESSKEKEGKLQENPMLKKAEEVSNPVSTHHRDKHAQGRNNNENSLEQILKEGPKKLGEKNSKDSVDRSIG